MMIIIVIRVHLFRKESCSTFFSFFLFLFSFFFFPFFSLCRKHQKTPSRARHCEMMKHGYAFGFLPIPSHMNLYIISKQLVEFQMLVRVQFEGIISPMCCVTYKTLLFLAVEILIAMTGNVLKDRETRLERYLLNRFTEELCSYTPGTSCSKDGQSYPPDKYYQNLLSYPLDSAIHPLNN